MPAMPDARNLSLSPVEQHNFNNNSCVDDNDACTTWDHSIPALQQSLFSAFICFGWPSNNHQGSHIPPDKWDRMVSYMVLLLGYKINSRTLMIT
jgi:hypothetical protein